MEKKTCSLVFFAVLNIFETFFLRFFSRFSIIILCSVDFVSYRSLISRKVVIYYGTRTHKQIGQVVKEFSRLPYGHDGVLK